MDRNQHQARRRHGGARTVGIVAGLGAVAAMVALTVAQHDDRLLTYDAGSGSAPANTTFSQPVVGGMSLGPTETMKTPPSAPAVSVAAPAIKHH
jgi:hypothetical protein